MRSGVGAVHAEPRAFKLVLIREELSGCGRKAEVVDLDLILMWREIAHGDVRLAQELEWLGHAANAQSANPDGGRSVSNIRLGGETRDPRERAEPQRAVAIAECGNHFASGQTVGDGEVLELAALGLEPIDTARRAGVEIAGPSSVRHQTVPLLNPWATV